MDVKLSTIRGIGNSHGLILDKTICDALGLSIGSNVRLLVDDGYLTIQPVAQRKVPTIGIAWGRKVADDDCFSSEMDGEIASLMGVL